MDLSWLRALLYRRCLDVTSGEASLYITSDMVVDIGLLSSVIAPLLLGYPHKRIRIRRNEMTTSHPIRGLDDAGGGKQLPTRQRIDDIEPC